MVALTRCVRSERAGGRTATLGFGWPAPLLCSSGRWDASEYVSTRSRVDKRRRAAVKGECGAVGGEGPVVWEDRYARSCTDSTHAVSIWPAAGVPCRPGLRDTRAAEPQDVHTHTHTPTQALGVTGRPAPCGNESLMMGDGRQGRRARRFPPRGGWLLLVEGGREGGRRRAGRAGRAHGGCRCCIDRRSMIDYRPHHTPTAPPAVGSQPPSHGDQPLPPPPPATHCVTACASFSRMRKRPSGRRSFLIVARSRHSTRLGGQTLVVGFERCVPDYRLGQKATPRAAPLSHAPQATRRKLHSLTACHVARPCHLSAHGGDARCDRRVRADAVRPV